LSRQVNETTRWPARDELTRIAGTRGDPLRAVELLPGVSRRAGNGGMPILRGANPDDSQVFVEGAIAPYLYHLGGLTSIVNARVLESVEQLARLRGDGLVLRYLATVTSP